MDYVADTTCAAHSLSTDVLTLTRQERLVALCNRRSHGTGTPRPCDFAWQAAHGCCYRILHCCLQVRPRISRWSWQHFNRRLELKREYVALYRVVRESKALDSSGQLQHVAGAGELLEELEKLEDSLSLADILYFRKIAEHSKRAEGHGSIAAKESWLSWGQRWVGLKGGTQSDDSAEETISPGLSFVSLSDSQRAAIYAALDYSDTADDPRAVSSGTKGEFSFQVWDGSLSFNWNGQGVVAIPFRNIKVSACTAADGLQATIAIKKFEMFDKLTKDSRFPVLIRSRVTSQRGARAHSVPPSESMVSIQLKSKANNTIEPIDGLRTSTAHCLADRASSHLPSWQVDISVQPLEVVVSSASFGKLAEVLRPAHCPFVPFEDVWTNALNELSRLSETAREIAFCEKIAYVNGAYAQVSMSIESRGLLIFWPSSVRDCNSTMLIADISSVALHDAPARPSQRPTAAPKGGPVRMRSHSNADALGTPPAMSPIGIPADDVLVDDGAWREQLPDPRFARLYQSTHLGVHGVRLLITKATDDWHVLIGRELVHPLSAGGIVLLDDLDFTFRAHTCLLLHDACLPLSMQELTFPSLVLCITPAIVAKLERFGQHDEDEDQLPPQMPSSQSTQSLGSLQSAGTADRILSIMTISLPRVHCIVDAKHVPNPFPSSNQGSASSTGTPHYAMLRRKRVYAHACRCG